MNPLTQDEVKKINELIAKSPKDQKDKILYQWKLGDSTFLPFIRNLISQK